MTTPKTPDLAAVVRCDYTKNPCGSDTHRVGNPCNCLPCRGFAYGYDRAQADLAALRAELSAEVGRTGRQEERAIAAEYRLTHYVERVGHAETERNTLHTELAALRERLAVLIANDGLTQYLEMYCVFCGADRSEYHAKPHKPECPVATRTPGAPHEAE